MLIQKFLLPLHQESQGILEVQVIQEAPKKMWNNVNQNIEFIYFIDLSDILIVGNCFVFC